MLFLSFFAMIQNPAGSNAGEKGVTASLRGEDMVFLKELATAVVEASRVRPGEMVGNFGPNTYYGTLIRPGGRVCYPFFWVRDFAMSLESGLIPPVEQKHALILTAATQQEGDVRTATVAKSSVSNSLIPNGAIADHISFAGSQPIFFPGTLNNYYGPPFGLPCLDDHFYFVHMAWWYVRATGDSAILKQEINSRKLIDRLDLAFTVPPSKQDTHLVSCNLENRGVNFGFFDVVIHTGDLLFCSVLKYRAAQQLAELHRLIGNQTKSQEYKVIAERIYNSIPGTFASKNGLLKASTGKSSQPDVWGSAFAVYAGAVKPEQAKSICLALADAYKKGTLAYHGYIRHVLTSDDYNESSAWEWVMRVGPKGSRDKDGFWNKNRYQNGAYWSTPLGWVCYAIAQVDKALASQLATEYINELRKDDFRKGAEFGSPWECMHPDGNYRQYDVFMTSVTCPLAAFQRLGWD